MSLWSRITGAWSALTTNETKMTIEEWFSEFGPSSKSVTGISVNQLSALQVSTVMSCVAILAEDVAKLPVHVYRKQANGGKEIVKDHPLERLFVRPNDFQNRFEFIEQMQCAFLLRGNAYAAIIRSGRGVPTALIPINPDRVWIYEAQDGSVFYEVARSGPHDMAVLRSLPSRIASEDMLHLKWMSQSSSLWGSSRVNLAREVIALALSQQELAGRLSANSTNLGGVLETDQKLSADAAERMGNDWRRRKARLEHAGDVAVLEQGLKWKPLGMTANDAQFIPSRELQVLEIARIFRMPPHKLGVMERMAGNSLEQVDQDYMNNVASAYLTRWEEKFEECFSLDDDGLFVEFDIAKFLRAAIQTRYNAYRTGIVGMFLTPNEVRRAEGLPDDPDGDTLYQPTNVAPIGFDPQANQTGPGSDVTGKPAPGGDGDPSAAPHEPTGSKD